DTPTRLHDRSDHAWDRSRSRRSHYSPGISDRNPHCAAGSKASSGPGGVRAAVQGADGRAGVMSCPYAVGQGGWLMPVQEVHERCLTTAAFLSSHQMAKPILPLEVVQVLNRAKIRFVLVGAYGFVGWLKEPAATQGVDVVVA